MDHSKDLTKLRDGSVKSSELGLRWIQTSKFCELGDLRKVSLPKYDSLPVKWANA